MCYMCFSIYMSFVFLDYGFNNVWNYCWNVEDFDQIVVGFGVFYVSEIFVLFGLEYVLELYINVLRMYREGEFNENVVDVIQKYWISFIKIFDFNIEWV